jgi:hypothetical protein
MWQELGIAPTADTKEIRRAYARRLKAIDADRDPAAFQRLRQALEAALAAVDRGSRKSEGSPGHSSGLGAVTLPRERPLPDPGAARPPPSPVVTDLAALDLAADGVASRALRQDFSQALAKGDVEGACARLTTGIAQGLVALADQQEMIAKLMAAAVDDRRLSGESFTVMAQQFGWAKLQIGDADLALRERVTARLEAEAWVGRFTGAAAVHGRWPSCADREARAFARGVLGLGPAWPLLLIHSGMIHWFFASYDRFEPWLGDRFDAKRIRRLRAARAWKPRQWVATILWGLGVLLFDVPSLIGAPGRWRRQIAPVNRGVPEGWAALRTLPGLDMVNAVVSLVIYLMLGACVAALALGLIVAAIVFPPLGALIVLAGIVARVAKAKKRK